MTKPLSELTHYEVLEVDRDADLEEVERAFRLAQSTWADDSLATYSVYDESQAASMRERIELAWSVLQDEERRREYDAGLAEPARDDPFDLSLGLFPEEEAPRGIDEVPPSIPQFEGLGAEAEGDYDGSRLRRSRLERGVELDQIAQVTKINTTYLRYLEEENFPELPAPVYVRGFVTAYARCIGLDPERVVTSYMNLVKSRATPERRTRLGRR